MRLLFTLGLIIYSCSISANSTKINDIQFSESTPQSTRLIFDLSAPITHNVFTLPTPDRLVIDLKNVLLSKDLEVIPHPQSLIKKIRSAVRNDNDLRVVLDLNKTIHTKSFLLKPTGKYGYRLVIEMSTSQSPRATTALSSSLNKALVNLSAFSSNLLPEAIHTVTPVTPPENKPVAMETLISTREILIAIDAGHGGIDSGTVGQNGTLEKAVVLGIATDLATQLETEPGMRPFLIRNGDYFLELRRRVELAREYQADLFVSIHADAYPGSSRINGSSVYMLSPSGASSEAAQWLADKENSADLLGGITLNDKDELLASVLINLSQAGTLEASALVGNSVLKTLKTVGNNHFTSVQRANFMVLRSPEIPSILIETSFLSNSDDEKKLNDSEYRWQIAQAILAGIREYFAVHPPLHKVVAHR